LNKVKQTNFHRVGNAIQRLEGNMIHAEGISKSYDSIEALRQVSFSIAPGEIVGLLGPNGAGKTTAMKILTGYLQPDEGTATVDGLDVLAHPRQVQERIGYLPENAPLYPELSVQSYLRMMADLRQIPEPQQVAWMSEAVLASGLADRLTQPIGELSKGLRQRVGLAQAILHKPKILILDEPTLGLDPTQIVEVRQLIKRLAAQSTILFSTHILSEVEALCDRVLILINGQIKADAKLTELASTADAIVVLEKEARGIRKALKALEDVQGLERSKTPEGYPLYRVLGKPDVEGADLCPAIYRLAQEHAWPLRELRRDVRTLETVFNQLATAM
jgi:ABC-2 type transport system ATP-binding protein